MRIKEIDRTANVAWSPAQVDPVYLAVGTAAQQLDSSFSTNCTLELYQFDINQSGLDLPVKASLPCENRFHKLAWGAHGISNEGGQEGEHPMGVIVGGCDNGIMQVYDASKILKNENPLVLTKTKHTGAVRALDFNPFRSNLVASGASESEIFIWDLTNPKTPMTPGTKVQPADDVSHLAWNKQVEHILASTFPTRCVVWDLRKNEPVIKVSDTTSRIRYKVVEWHPEVATQMCLASEDDNSPVIQLWDLRYATAPLKVIQGHQRGILGMAWCPQDPDLLLTCGKESRILCWNPNFLHPGYEMVCDIPTASQYSFDVSFCPKNPIVIASSSFDGRVSIFGLSGGMQHPVTSSKLADSFPGMDMTLSTPVPTQPPSSLQLRDAPKWLKRPCGASFAFGGKLITFSSSKAQSTVQGHPPVVTSVVNISQLVTLPNLIERSKKLEETLQSGSLESYCADKAGESGDGHEVKIWEFLQANFSQNPRQAYLSKLGFDMNDIMTKLDKYSSLIEDNKAVNGLADDFESLGRGAPDGYSNGFDFTSSSKIPDFEKELTVPTNDNTMDGKINQALLCGSIDIAVNLCLEDERWADALLLATKSSPELLAKAQNKYFQKSKNEATQLVRAVVTNDLNRLVERCELDSWKQVLAVITTYAENQEFSLLSDKLGQRLQGSKVESQKLGALLCCICSGNLNHLVDVWIGDSDKHHGDSPDELQDLVEQVMILKKAGEVWGRETNIDGGPLASKLVEYSNLLASQGCLELALNFLGDSSDQGVENLKQRLYYSLRYTRPTRSQIVPRSRQSSDSSLRSSSLTKRPSYPNASNVHSGLSRGSSLNQTDFSNLTGPVHPPAAPQMYGQQQQQQYGNLYVNSNLPNSVGQFTPPGQIPQQGSYGAVPVGLPPRPPSTNPSSFYNPADVPVSNSFAPHKDPPPTRTPLGSSLPQPPVSSAAHGWNDPPPIKAGVKPKPTPVSVASTAQPITHPIFGTATPEQTRQDTYGSNMYGNQSNPSSMMQPPQQSQNQFYSPPTSSSYSTQSSQYSGGNTFAPPPPQSGFGPPPSSSSYGAPAPNSFGPPPTMQSGFGTGPQQGPPLLQNSFAPPPQQHSQSSSYGPPPPSQQNTFAPPPAQHNTFAPPPSAQSSFGQPQSPNSFGGPPQTGFGSSTGAVGPPPQSAFGAPPPAKQAGPLPPSMNSAPTGPPPPMMNSGPGGPPPSMMNSGPPPSMMNPSPTGPPPPMMNSGPSGPPPPTSGGFSSRPPSVTSASAFTSAPPAVTPNPNLTFPPSAPPAPSPQFSQQSPFPPPPTSGNIYTPSSTPQQMQQMNPLLPPTATPPPPSSQFPSSQSSFVPNPASTFQPITPSPSMTPTPQMPPQTAAKTPEPPKQLGPIPPEHKSLLETLEKLRSECYEVAHLHQMKRKLEDVARKLDLFTEKLRLGSINENILATLHQMVDAISAKNYPHALQIHTQLVTSGNFADISTFLPSIKVLIQCATQLNV